MLSAVSVSRLYDVYCFCLFCRKAREDEMDASRRLNEMIANYGDVIPRRDYQQLQKENEVALLDTLAVQC